MKTTKSPFLRRMLMTAVVGPRLSAQVQTDAPPSIAGAKPVTAEHIKVRAVSLRGNLEGHATDLALPAINGEVQPNFSRNGATVPQRFF